MPEKLRVGAVACPAKVNAVDENLAVIADWADAAVQEKVDILLFPELGVTGYSTNGPATAPLAPGHFAVRRLAALAAECGLTLAAGLAWQEEEGGAKYLAHGLWQPSGEFHLYKKTHLGRRERREYAAGDELPVFRLSKVTVGMQLCLEQHFPDIAQTLALKGAQIILCPHATPRLAPAERRASWHISLRARAYDNCVYILATNQAGDNGQGTFYHGGALLIDPEGKVLAEDFSGQPSMIAAEINLGRVAAVRTTPQGMCRRFYAPQRRPELYL